MDKVEVMQVSPNELVNLIAERLKTDLQEVLSAVNKKPVNNEDDFLTRKETAAFFKASLVSIHQWVNDGLIKPYKVGNRTYFKKAELIKVLESSNRV